MKRISLTKNGALHAIEIALYVVLIADGLVLMAAFLTTGDWSPPGSGGFLVLLVLIGVVQRLRHGPDFWHNY